MIVSYNWLQQYLEKPLPKHDGLAHILTVGAFEVESVEKKGDDYIFDIDVLPNRAHDCLSHEGIAREIAVLTDNTFKPVLPKDAPENFEPDFDVRIDTGTCRRYIGCQIKGMRIGESPETIKRMLEAIGQRPINNIVDITNIVMYEIGQPMHAFDVAKVKGDIVIRDAETGEKITTLDDKEIELDESIAVISDQKGPLAIAGVKGGNRAEVDADTKDIILESANFVPAPVRRTANAIGIKTDSSKRFENDITPELAEKGMKRAIELILEHASTEKTEVSAFTERYLKKPNMFKVGASIDEINSLLGTDIKEAELEQIFTKLGFEFEKVNPREIIVETAQSAIGIPYTFGASVLYDAPSTFDCSSLSSYSYVQAGIGIPRISIDQYVYGEEIVEKDLQPGDLVFFSYNTEKTHFESKEYLPGIKVEGGIDHTAIYIGDGKIIHATQKIGEVVEEKLKEAGVYKDLVGFRRIEGVDKERYVVTIPHERLDIRIKNDLIEEVGRIYGYDNISSSSVAGIDYDPEINKEFYYTSVVRNALIMMGFSEIFTQSFADEGNFEVLKPASQEKPFLRTNLKDGMLKALELNEYNADFVGVDIVKTFEIGKIFGEDGEKLNLCIGVKNKNIKKPKEHEQIDEALEKLFGDYLNQTHEEKAPENELAIEIDLGEVIQNMPEPEDSYPLLRKDETVVFKTLSPYPFVLRDIAVWLPGKDSEESRAEIEEILTQKGTDLLVNHRLFDVYTKEDENKTSYAFRLVFQSFDRTLSDDEINEIMQEITDVLSSKKDWEVR